MREGKKGAKLYISWKMPRNRLMSKNLLKKYYWVEESVTKVRVRKSAKIKESARKIRMRRMVKANEC